MPKQTGANASEWDAIALDWDENRSTHPSATLSFFKGYAKGTVLDAGCGNGRNSVEFAKAADHVIALDASAAMLEASEKNVNTKPEARAKVEFLQAKIEKMSPIADASVDAVFCLAALHHVKPQDQSKAAAEFFRVLKRDGRLCLTVWNRQQRRFAKKPKELDVPWHGKPRYYYFFDENELISLLETAGFTVEKMIYEKNGQSVLAEKAQNLCLIATKAGRPKPPKS